MSLRESIKKAFNVSLEEGSDSYTDSQGHTISYSGDTVTIKTKDGKVYQKKCKDNSEAAYVFDDFPSPNSSDDIDVTKIDKSWKQISESVNESNMYYVVKNTAVTDTIFADNPEDAKEIAKSHDPYHFDGKEVMDPYEYDSRFGDGTLKDRKYAVLGDRAIDMTVAKSKDEAAEEFTGEEFDTIMTFDEFVNKYQHCPEADIADNYDDSFLDNPSFDLWDPGMP